MIPDDNSLLSEEELVAMGISSKAINAAREAGILLPRASGRSYKFVAREVCAAIAAMPPVTEKKWTPLRKKKTA